jgi:hypothetical protein
MTLAQKLEFYSLPPSSPNGCRIWTGDTDDDGYGMIKVGGKRRRAHRVSYEQENGPIPEDVQALHSCDNPPCIRADHLFLGTNEDNHRDKCIKGRARNGQMNGFRQRGSQNGRAVLTEAQVLRMRADKDTSTNAFAREFGVRWTTANAARNGKHWSHLGAQS